MGDLYAIARDADKVLSLLIDLSQRHLDEVNGTYSPVQGNRRIPPFLYSCDEVFLQG